MLEIVTTRKYTIVVEAEGHETHMEEIEIKGDGNEALRLDFARWSTASGVRLWLSHLGEYHSNNVWILLNDQHIHNDKTIKAYSIRVDNLYFTGNEMARLLYQIWKQNSKLHLKTLKKKIETAIKKLKFIW